MKVGFIGLGSMGREMASQLQATGHSLVVHDVRVEAASTHLAAGATWALHPADVMAASDVTFTSLPNPEDVEAVALGDHGLIEAAQPGKVYFDLSTNAVSTVREIHRRFAEQGAVVCDAPVSGGPTGAANRKLTVYVGGDEHAVDAHRELLEAFSDQVLFVGPIGAGTIAKLMHQSVGFVVNAVVAEVFSVGVKAGIDPLDLWRALRTGAVGRRRTFDGIETQFLQHEFDRASFPLALAHKDARLATQVGRDVDVPMRLTEIALADMTAGLERGRAHRGSQVSMLVQSERADVHIEISPAEVQAELGERTA